jgi:YesN/AraC family two-component response regulator
LIDQAGFLIAGGKSIASERIQGVNDNMLKSHYHEYFELYYLEYGHRYHIINGELYSLNAGEFSLFPPYVMHHSYGENNIVFKRLLVYFKPEVVMIPEVLSKLNSSIGVYKLNNKAGKHIYSKLVEILAEQNSRSIYSEEAMQMILNQLLIEIVRHTSESLETKPEKQDRITQILNYLHLNYAENIMLEELAAKFYISPYYLCREFKHYTNSTIIHYVNTLRVIRAQRMLMETNKSITDISIEVGFSNITHFGRVFKAIADTTPSKYRNRVAER